MEIGWENIACGDKTAFSELYTFYYKKFFNYGRKFTDDGPLLEDVIQEVLITIWTRRNNLKTIQNPHNYFFCTFRRSLFLKLKESKNALPATTPFEPEFSIDSIIIKRENDLQLQAKLKAAMNMLTSRQREAIYLRFYEGLSYEEVAETLDITVKATYKIVARALLQLKSNLSMPYLLIVLLLRKTCFDFFSF